MGYTNFSKDRFSKDNFTKINFIKTGGRNMCDKFIGRKNELKSLETAYSKNSFHLILKGYRYAEQIYQQSAGGT